MRKIPVTSDVFVQFMFKQDFKEFLLKEYDHAWHTLSNITLGMALDKYNKINKTWLKKFWD